MSHHIQAESLQGLCREIFEASGAPGDIASVVAESLVLTNLFGHDSHGVLRVKQYVRMINDGMTQPGARPFIKRSFGATAMVSGAYGFGQVSARFAAELVIELGRRHGIGAVSLGQCAHIGRLGEYTEMIAAAGLIGICFTSGTMYRGWVTPYGGRERVFGTNPMSFAVPCEDAGALLLDFATAGVAHGKVVQARAEGNPVPIGMMLDKRGRPTTDASVLDEGAVLLPMGLHKGSGLAMMMEIIPTLLAGHRPITSAEFHFGNPSLMMALDPRAFDEDTDFRRHVGALRRRVKEAAPAEGFDEVLLPGEPETRSYRDRIRNGIPLPDAVWDDLQGLARHLGLRFPGDD